VPRIPGGDPSRGRSERRRGGRVTLMTTGMR
jgi:hypothetical protein